MDDPMKFLLRQVQLIARDRLWNNKYFEAQSKITDCNISDILNPKINPGIAERTHDTLSEDAKKGDDDGS